MESCSLPEMPTKRCESAAVSAGSPECLIVAGGVSNNDVDTAVVEILKGEQWLVAQSLPVPCYSIALIFHSGCLFVGGNTLSCNIRFMHNFLFYCSLEALITPSGDTVTDDTSTVWKQSSKRLSREILNPTPFLYGEQLLAIGQPLSYEVGCNKIYAYSSTSESWVHVDNLPISEAVSTATSVLPTGELMVMAGKYETKGKFIYRVLKGQLESKQCNIHS